ncbi:MAG: hypothetical protein IJM87_10310 [Ruminococcus sp.]|nr:hypothetical protein [Ruminococcus sp.]
MAETKSKIFRQKSLDRISSPEQLTDYFKVTNPGVWLILGAVVFLLAGLLVWASVGKLDTVVDASVTVENGTAVVMPISNSTDDLEKGMTVIISGNEYTVTEVRKDFYGRPSALIKTDMPDGNYDGQIVTESISPISFLLK